MQYYDLGLRTADPAALALAQKLGFHGVAVLHATPPATTLPVGKGLLVVPSKAAGARRHWELLAVDGKEREASETVGVDIVFPRELDYIMARLAKRNGVMIGFSFHPILHATKQHRGEILGAYFQIARLVNKYRVPFILTSGAESAWDLRSPADLITFGRVIGLLHPEDGLSGERLLENRSRLKKGWVMPGVSVVE